MDLELCWQKSLFMKPQIHLNSFPLVCDVYIMLNTNKKMSLLVILKGQPI